MSERFARTELLLGDGSIEMLFNKKVAVFGLGGVGGYVVEGLARCGVGNFVLVDNDVVSITNINRQILALTSTVGKLKTELAKQRILDINPMAKVEIFDKFYLQLGDVNIDSCDYVVDAIDTVSAKLNLVKDAVDKNIPIISAMGCGNKMDMMAFKIADIFETKVCPLCKVMRKELRNRGILKLEVVYSTEEPKKINVGTENGRHPPASAMFTPSTAGILMSLHIIKNLLNKGDYK